MKQFLWSIAVLTMYFVGYEVGWFVRGNLDHHLVDAAKTTTVEATK